MQPAAIKSFLDKVSSTPEDELADVLEAFTWKADKVSCGLETLNIYMHIARRLIVLSGRLPPLGPVVQFLRCILRETRAVKTRPSAQKRICQDTGRVAISYSDRSVEGHRQHT